MEFMRLGAVEMRFAELIWQNEPLSSGELVKLCAKELDWKKSTSYTVLKKLCERGIFQNKDSTVTSLISRDEFFAGQSESIIENAYGGSLPAFLAAFTKRKALTAEEIAEIKRMIDAAET